MSILQEYRKYVSYCFWTRRPLAFHARMMNVRWWEFLHIVSAIIGVSRLVAQEDPGCVYFERVFTQVRIKFYEFRNRFRSLKRQMWKHNCAITAAYECPSLLLWTAIWEDAEVVTGLACFCSLFSCYRLRFSVHTFTEEWFILWTGTLIGRVWAST